MNEDSVVRLAAAAKQAHARPALDLCTPGLPAELRDQGLTCRYLRRDELRATQRRSTILYLPQAFRSNQPLMIRHNFPTKAMEYLCSGRPILVHSPSDSYLAWLARREGFALVVDRPDVADLAEAIDRLVEDRNLQKSWSPRHWPLCERATASVGDEAMGSPEGITRCREENKSPRRNARRAPCREDGRYAEA